MYGYYFDPTYILLIIGMVLSLAASAKVKGTFAKYSKVHSTSGLTGAEAAQQILHMAGITDVSVVAVAGSLTDHYDPRTRQVALSQDVYGKTSVAAIGVAAHECGHAIQDAVNYAPLNIRTAIVPAANIGSTLSWPLFLAGLVFSIRPLLTVGILLFSLAVLFQLVTLPVEFSPERVTVISDSACCEPWVISFSLMITEAFLPTSALVRRTVESTPRICVVSSCMTEPSPI